MAVYTHSKTALATNFVQFLITLSIVLWFKLRRKRESRQVVAWALGMVAAWYIVIFPFDLEHILLKR